MTILQIDLNKLEKNYHSLRKRLNPNSKMIGVIKANAYGGVYGPIAEKLVEMGIEALAVAYTEEGVQLRKLGIKIPILVFYPQVQNFRTLIQKWFQDYMEKDRSNKK